MYFEPKGSEDIYNLILVATERGRSSPQIYTVSPEGWWCAYPDLPLRRGLIRTSVTQQAPLSLLPPTP